MFLHYRCPVWSFAAFALDLLRTVAHTFSGAQSSHDKLGSNRVPIQRLREQEFFSLTKFALVLSVGFVGANVFAQSLRSENASGVQFRCERINGGIDGDAVGEQGARPHRAAVILQQT